MSNPADYFMTVLSPANAIDDDDVSEVRVVKSEGDILKDYTKKINYILDKYNQSDLKNDYSFRSSEVVEIVNSDISRCHTGFWF